MTKSEFIPRDISWLSFNARVLQEADDPDVPLRERIRFLGIFSNNLDEFFRVRVATLKRMALLAKKEIQLEEDPQQVLNDIQVLVLRQQNEFGRIWRHILSELNRRNVFLINDTELNEGQRLYVEKFFKEEVRRNVIPLLPESNPNFPYLREKSLYLGVVMSKRETAYDQKYAFIEVPAGAVGRFVLLPPEGDKQFIILLEDVIRHNLPSIFSYFGYEQFSAHIFKINKDAELDFEDDLSTSLAQKIEKALKNRRKGKPVRLAYDKEIDAGLLEYLIRKLNLSRKDNIIPGGRIHNFRHFMDFPDVFGEKPKRQAPITHPLLLEQAGVTNVVLKRDILLHFPYHSFDPVIDLLRESAMDPEVVLIKITLYRLAADSKVINALVNAARNGKQVTVVLELKARFDEEANLGWKKRLELEGVRVLTGLQHMKVHSKICLIRKRVGRKTVQYGLVSTGNFNEKTSRIYSDHCLLTSNRQVMADINRIFDCLEGSKSGIALLKSCRTLLVSPTGMRQEIANLIRREIKQARLKKPASIILKLNSLSDHALIEKLYEAAYAGVEVKLIVRGIFCAVTDNEKFRKAITAISIVDEYLEHARVMIFHNGGKQKVFISSADWMGRNLDHRIEAAVPLLDKDICGEVQAIINIQLQDNTKARILSSGLSNNYVADAGSESIRSQRQTYQYLYDKAKAAVEPAAGAVTASE